MQCKDIPNDVVFAGIRKLRLKPYDLPNEPQSKRRTPRWVMCWELSEYIEKQMKTEIPSNLYWAKMRQLIDKNWIGGCPCTCRGDYVIEKEHKAYNEKLDSFSLKGNQ